ncbi:MULTISPECIES: hypothetical protein [unclassified Rhodococcus (in: high G+C Gram-positive bacteria)]|nr:MULTISPECIES: hypothetical protein [unclassified Rhodococcus (in: high G+C Gram-positive bacteria)]HET8994288.1 hypothetical protein [Rhodococcus sp. (in: high G+C Gram-positive bacteria)]
MSTCTTDSTFDSSAAPGSTEWIKAHLARMDEDVQSDDMAVDRRN